MAPLANAAANIGEGHIDSASAYGVLSALSYPQPSNCYGWAWQNAIEVTSAIISTPHLKIAPEPGQERQAEGLFRTMLVHLSEAVTTRPRVSAEIAADAARLTKRWVRRNEERLRELYKQLGQDQKNYGNWLEWHIANAWTEHSNRLGGLFDATFMYQLARLLRVRNETLKDLRDYPAKRRELSTLVKTRSPADLFDLLVSAYVLSALIRGRYYGYIAKQLSAQLLHHPIRDNIFARRTSETSVRFPVSNTERYLSTIIVASAFRERGLERRVVSWSEMVKRARRLAVSTESLDLQEKIHDNIALDHAVDAARKLGVTTRSKWIEKGIEAGATLGVGILTSFVLEPWWAFAVGVGSGAATQKARLGKRASRTLESKRRLRDLAGAGSGRLSRSWTSGITVARESRK